MFCIGVESSNSNCQPIFKDYLTDPFSNVGDVSVGLHVFLFSGFSLTEILDREVCV